MEFKRIEFLKDVIVNGDLTVQGTSYAEGSEQILTKGALTVINSDNNDLNLTLMGTVIRTGKKDDNDNYIDYAIIYDPLNEAVRLGNGTYDSELNTFAFNENEGKPVATRDFTEEDDGSLVMWDANNYCFVKAMLSKGEGDNTLVQNGNTAISSNAAALGSENIVGSHVYDILDVDVENKTFTLSSIEGLEPGMEYSYHLNHAFANAGKIVSVQTDTALREIVTAGGTELTYEYMSGNDVVATKVIPASIASYVSPGTTKPVASANIVSDGLFEEDGVVYDKLRVTNTNGSNHALILADENNTLVGGKYLIIKMRTTTDWNTTWGGIHVTAEGESDVYFGGGYNTFYTAADNQTWRVIFFDMASLNLSGKTITNLYFQVNTLNLGMNIDIAYAAFCDTWKDIDAIVDEETVVQAPYNKGASWSGSSSIVNIAERVAEEEVAVASEDYAVNGAWIWNEEIDYDAENDWEEIVSFQSYGQSWEGIKNYAGSEAIYYQVYPLEQDLSKTVYVPYAGWVYKPSEPPVIDFGIVPQKVTEKFYNYLLANATRIPADVTPRKSVTVDNISSIAAMTENFHSFWISGRPDLGDLIMGGGAFAEGMANKAQNACTHAEGYDNIASGKYAHVEGKSNEASGYGSHAQGRNTIANGFCAHAEGEQTRANGDDSHAEGNGTQANGQWAHAEGKNTQANGRVSHTEGQDTVAEGQYTHAEGWRTKASGDCSHSEGEATQATGGRSHAEGYNTKATGNATHAQGEATIASAYASSAEGWGTETGSTWDSRAQHVAGRYNVVVENKARITGGGTSAQKKNIEELDWNGNLWLAGKVTATDVIVNGKKVLVEGDAANVDVLGEIAEAETVTMNNVVSNGTIKIGNTTLNEEQLIKILNFIEKINIGGKTV